MAASLMLATAVMSAKDLWVIDPGHGGQDWGCHTRRHREKDITLAIAKEVGNLIKKEIPGVAVAYTRQGDTYPTLPARCQMANSRGAQLFLAIHVNDAPNAFAHGTESYFGKSVPRSGQQAGKSELLALLLQRAYLDHGRGISRGVKQYGWYVCEHTNMPSVLTEVGFISNLEEEEFMCSKKGQARLARAIVDALKQWRELTRSGAVSRRTLRNLRFQYFDPRRQQPKATAATDSNSSSRADNSGTGSEATAAANGSSNTDTAAHSGDAATKETTSSQPATAADMGDTRFFAVQICNISTKVKTTDPRLKGLQDLRLFEDEGRFKVIHGRDSTYKDARRRLAGVRKLFPDAFIVAFDGERQISVAEARNPKP